MTIQNGRYETDSAEDILDMMMADAEQYFGEDLNDTSSSVIRLFYRPIAERLADAQEDIGLVLDSSQIDHATGTALDLLTALIGITRAPATTATGEVTFSRNSAAPQDYPIPTGTVVQTDSNTPEVFETTESTIISEGETSATAPVEAVEAGVDGNVGANTIRIIPDNPSGVTDVTNAAETDGGAEAETDDELRERAKDELATGSRASAPALINSVQAIDGVTTVTIFINDTGDANAYGNGLPAHSFELVVAGGNENEIGQAILNTKAAGDTAHGGANGTSVTITADLPNGQVHDVSFSRPEEITIYSDATIETIDGYPGDNNVRDEIVRYIGGLMASGNEVDGLDVNKDVLHGEVEFAIRSVPGVYDVSSLTIGTSPDPTGTSNITISQSQVATTSGIDDTIQITTDP